MLQGSSFASSDVRKVKIDAGLVTSCLVLFAVSGEQRIAADEVLLLLSLLRLLQYWYLLVEPFGKCVEVEFSLVVQRMTFSSQNRFSRLQKANFVPHIQNEFFELFSREV